jgi:bifunctional ADP-heptose synthase (sugar kinase/adenylyltransferase)
MIHRYSVECFELARPSDTDLVVGISADESASALEYSRSVNSTTSSRIRVVAGLACVDFMTMLQGLQRICCGI